jgi:uncharacterized SAM-binding protein YcdF (DUF218 family)
MWLVTSNFHMRRSLLLFRRAMPQATILPYPVVPAPGISHDGWWTNRLGIETVSHEMVKYLATFFHLPVH